MGAALALTWTLGQFFFLCSFSQPTLTIYWTGIFFGPQDGKMELTPLRRKGAGIHYHKVNL